MSKVTFLGAGSFGTSLAILLANKGNKVSLWDRQKDVVEDININRKNDKYIKDLTIPTNVTAYENIDKALEDCEYLVLAIPSHVIRTMCKNIKKKINKNTIIINIAKGIEEGTNLRLSQVINEELPENHIVVLSGPSHAEEVAMGIPTTLVASSKEMKYAELVQDLFMCKNFRVYTNDDIVGVEIGGAVKNIIALAAGVSDGIGYGDNSKAALMTRGMAEIARIGIKMGGKAETFFGLTGMGDLIVTCTSMHSRNRRAGILLGQGKSVSEAVEEVGMVVEGIKACKAFYELKEKQGINMPITDISYKVLFNGKDPKEAVKELMERDKTRESI
ncbi:NAD(P)H-dependent glycerol-3-phosphate dehydrogenase [Clostridium tarantellae]|uniref:Glycerol-3-phosphate dehydrogenase [NAD(P)+] n=1 Tax=Clostridium tarantellae TaxID=39493 RepID=A0A6I1MJX0_9CLOT|nr:NAD(P)H-dependent glycerol-3-phosphate dehydrogenase [Clostridium tarantellae]MPQ42462.1 NAD(P)H-dependent glycerol-3-phosphate dehydrogenase [Clostridium tarantellae]